MLFTRIVVSVLEREVEPASAAGGDSDWERVLAEFRGSTVPDTLTSANIRVLGGEALLEELTGRAIVELGGHSQQYVTQAVQKILNRYEEVAAGGGWVCWGETLDGQCGLVPVIKPFCPRTTTQGRGIGQKTKVIKYETPLKAGGTSILPVIPEEYIQKIEARWGVSLRRDIPLWQAIQEQAGVPIAIAEGVKKALALIALGVPAIAVRGVAMCRCRCVAFPAAFAPCPGSA